MSPAPGEEMAVAGGGGEAPLPRRGKEERLPQWGQQETRDLITIRADLERDPSSARRNRTPWEVVAARMSDRGYRRMPDQCKSKWKSLVNRYKGKETADPDAGGRQWPFFDELSVVFMEPEKHMHRRLLESKPGSSQKKKPERVSNIGTSEESEDENDSDGEQQQQMELQWCKMMKRRQSREKLETEKLMLEQGGRRSRGGKGRRTEPSRGMHC